MLLLLYIFVLITTLNIANGVGITRYSYLKNTDMAGIIFITIITIIIIDNDINYY